MGRTSPRASARPLFTGVLAAIVLLAVVGLGPNLIAATAGPSQAVSLVATHALPAGATHAVSLGATHAVPASSAQEQAAAARAQVDALMERYQAASARVDAGIGALSRAFA